MAVTFEKLKNSLVQKIHILNYVLIFNILMMKEHLLQDIYHIGRTSFVEPAFVRLVASTDRKGFPAYADLANLETQWNSPLFFSMEDSSQVYVVMR